jgi:hypothetical protein
MQFYVVFGSRLFSDCSVACFCPQRLSSIFVELIPIGVLLHAASGEAHDHSGYCFSSQRRENSSTDQHAAARGFNEFFYWMTKKVD